MAHMPNTRLPALRPSADAKWLHCPDCSKGYWGAFRPTDFVATKFAAHVERKHAAKAQEGVDGDAVPAQLPRAKAPRAVPQVPALPGMAPLGKKAAAKAAKKGDGPVKVVREKGPATADLLGQAMADILQDMGGELNPRLQLAQGPRNFTDERERDRREPVKVANNGHAAMARAQAACSPLQGWA